MKYTHILQTDKIQKDFYLMIIKKIIKNLLKLFNETDKNSVLAVLSYVLPKRILKKEGFIFSNTMYRTAKRKHFTIEKGDEEVDQKTKKLKEIENELIINELKLHSEKSSKLYRNKPVYNLQESKLYIYKKIKKENPEVNLSLTKYYKLCPKIFQYSKKKTDMCDICINGKKLTKKNDKKMLIKLNTITII